jgi:SAM-dependent methyltransferase
MPGSYDFFKKDVKQHFIDNIDWNYNVLDVGPGYGTYGNLLKPEFVNISAIEIWEPYVENFKLNNIYKEIYIGDICDFDFSNFDYLILGDILEHIEVERAIELVNKIYNLNKKCLIAIPYMYPQGSHEGNIYETHHQPDLTHDVFLNRYSNMKCLFRNELYGYYINY